jgi:hypothetical protein
MSEEIKKYDIKVHHPDGGGPAVMTYTYADLELAVEGIGNIALEHVKGRSGVRRLFEIVPTPVPVKEEHPDATTTTPPGGTDPEGD